MWWQWVVIALMSLTPNLLLGQQMAAALGAYWQLPTPGVIAVMFVFGYASGFFWIWLGGKDPRWKLLVRVKNWMHRPRAVAFAKRWGLWGGMTLGVALVGQEPIILALRWIGVDGKKIWVPMILSNVISCVLYYYLVKIGMVSAEKAFRF